MARLIPQILIIIFLMLIFLLSFVALIAISVLAIFLIAFPLAALITLPTMSFSLGVSDQQTIPHNYTSVLNSSNTILLDPKPLTDTSLLATTTVDVYDLFLNVPVCADYLKSVKSWWNYRTKISPQDTLLEMPDNFEEVNINIHCHNLVIGERYEVSFVHSPLYLSLISPQFYIVDEANSAAWSTNTKEKRLNESAVYKQYRFDNSTANALGSESMGFTAEHQQSVLCLKIMRQSQNIDNGIKIDSEEKLKKKSTKKCKLAFQVEPLAFSIASCTGLRLKCRTVAFFMPAFIIFIVSLIALNSFYFPNAEKNKRKSAVTKTVPSKTSCKFDNQVDGTSNR